MEIWLAACSLHMASWRIHKTEVFTGKIIPKIGGSFSARFDNQRISH